MFKPGAAVRQHRARRRDQPHHAEDAVVPARGDERGAGLARPRHATRCRGRSWCWPRRTRSSSRARSRCPSRSSTASCCASASATRRAATRRLILRGAAVPTCDGARAGARPWPTCSRSRTAADAGARRRVGAGLPDGARRGHARVAALLAPRREPARVARAAARGASAARWSTAATTSSPTTSSASPSPALAHRVVLRTATGGTAGADGEAVMRAIVQDVRSPIAARDAVTATDRTVHRWPGPMRGASRGGGAAGVFRGSGGCSGRAARSGPRATAGGACSPRSASASPPSTPATISSTCFVDAAGLIVVSGVLSEAVMRGIRLAPILPDELYAGRPALVGRRGRQPQAPRALVLAHARRRCRAAARVDRVIASRGCRPARSGGDVGGDDCPRRGRHRLGGVRRDHAVSVRRLREGGPRRSGRGGARVPRRGPAARPARCARSAAPAARRAGGAGAGTTSTTCATTWRATTRV